MKFDEVKELITLIDNSSLSYLEVKIDNDYIKMDKSLSRSNNSTKKYKEKEAENLNTENKKVTEEKNIEYKKDLKDQISIDTNDDYEYIKSPMVGTFYKASSPDSNDFVTKGQFVKKGDVLCIVEAMKLMNEIVAEFDCEIVDILVNDQEMVQYSQEIFKIRR